MAVLKEWFLMEARKHDPHVAPEDSVLDLFGVVEGHPAVEDGHLIAIRLVPARVAKNGNKLIFAGESFAYEIENAKADYEAQFPGAKERFFAQVVDSKECTLVLDPVPHFVQNEPKFM